MGGEDGGLTLNLIDLEAFQAGGVQLGSLETSATASVDIGAGAVLGLRLPLYVAVAGVCVLYDIDYKEPLSASEIALFVFIGLLLTVPPLYTLQKAVSLISTLTISALTALGPFFIFGLQLIEGRVEYSTATLAGLSIYFAGALFSAFGAVRATTASQAGLRHD